MPERQRKPGQPEKPRNRVIYVELPERPMKIGVPEPNYRNNPRKRRNPKALRKNLIQQISSFSFPEQPMARRSIEPIGGGRKRPDPNIRKRPVQPPKGRGMR